MSYSFTFSTLSAASAKDAVKSGLDEVVANQPIHAADRDAVESAAGKMIDVLGDPADGKVISGSVSGSCYKQDSADEGLTGVSLNVSLNFALNTNQQPG